jgi:hypothetical protein
MIKMKCFGFETDYNDQQETFLDTYSGFSGISVPFFATCFALVFHMIYMLKLLRQLRGGGGGVNQLLLCLNNFKSIKPFLIFLQVTINIIQYMNNINNEHHSHIRYT